MEVEEQKVDWKQEVENDEIEAEEQPSLAGAAANLLLQ